MAENSKYIPLKDIGIGGIIVMRYGQTDQPEELVEPVAGLMTSLYKFGWGKLKFISVHFCSNGSQSRGRSGTWTTRAVWVHWRLKVQPHLKRNQSEVWEFKLHFGNKCFVTLIMSYSMDGDVPLPYFWDGIAMSCLFFFAPRFNTLVNDYISFTKYFFATTSYCMRWDASDLSCFLS